MQARRARALWLGLGLALAGLPAWAEITPEDIARTGPRDAAVERALAWERLQTEITYLRPSADFKPDEAVRIAVPDPDPTEEEASRQARWTWGIVFGLILLGIAIVIARFGNRIQVTFSGSERRRARAGAEAAAPEAAAEAGEGFLERLAAMADRRTALILLVGRALERAAATNGVRLARAQTARDVLRVLPGRWTHHPALRELVREAELVHFGGRDIGEDRWQACLATARPIFGGAAAR